jgi:phasin family protein
MTTMFEDAGVFGKEFVDKGMKSFSSVSKAAQAIVTETSDYTKKSYESGAAAFEKLFSAKSVEAAIEIQTDFAKKAYEDFVAETGKLSGLYADMAKEAYKPFESFVAKAK